VSDAFIGRSFSQNAWADAALEHRSTSAENTPRVAERPTTTLSDDERAALDRVGIDRVPSEVLSLPARANALLRRRCGHTMGPQQPSESR
jgi:hypothetical protein